MNTTIRLFLKFIVTYKRPDNGEDADWIFYGHLYPSGLLRIADPAFKVNDCESKNYFNNIVVGLPTNKGNLLFMNDEIIKSFTYIGLREVFKPYESIHFHYEGAELPKVKVMAKVDQFMYEEPWQIKSNVKEHWIQAVTEHRIVVRDKNGIHVSGNNSILVG